MMVHTICSEKSIEKQLEELFSDTLDSGTSFSAILLSYKEFTQYSEQVRTLIGVPYGIQSSNNVKMLEIGPYFKDIVTASPTDWNKLKKQIPIKDILYVKKVELSDIFE